MWNNFTQNTWKKNLYVTIEIYLLAVSRMQNYDSTQDQGVIYLAHWVPLMIAVMYLSINQAFVLSKLVTQQEHVNKIESQEYVNKTENMFL